MKRTQVNALLSDYDETLCSTSSNRDDINIGGTIPEELEQALVHISESIPVCIVSSKDFTFLHEKVRFANILSCVLGIKTVIHNPHNSDNYDCVRYQHLIASSRSLEENSKMLHSVVKILQNRKEIMIEEKYHSAKEILIGLTVDYRHLQNWQLFKENKEPMLRELIERS